MSVSFLKRGKAVMEETKKADAATAAKKAAASASLRFFIKKDAEGEKRITFLDGGLDDNGFLDTPCFYEHNMKIDGRWGNHFVCTNEFVECPLCADGDTPALCYVATIIDHSKWVDREGRAHQNEKKLFVFKRETYKKLNNIAVKRDGLAGCTFDVGRFGERAPSVGDSFDFIKKRSISEIREAHDLSEDDVTPCVYEEVLNYKTPEELQKLGFGTKGGKPIGADDATQTEVSDVDKEL